jgi:hypothetical protein
MRPIPVALAAATLVSAALIPFAAPAQAGASTGLLFHDGETVRTVLTPTAMPGRGVDPIYAFPEGGAVGQRPVTAVAPGEVGYHGGRWAVHLVTWNTAPVLLTSDEEIEAAAAAGDITVVRMPAADFVCPVTGRA